MRERVSEGEREMGRTGKSLSNRKRKKGKKGKCTNRSYSEEGENKNTWLRVSTLSDLCLGIMDWVGGR